jgi:hypothetical protein
MATPRGFQMADPKRTNDAKDPQNGHVGNAHEILYYIEFSNRNEENYMLIIN